MPSTKKILRKLIAARDEQTLVKVKRSLKHGNGHDGFVLAIGREWMLMASTVSGGHLDGHVAVRINDVKSVRRDKSFAPRLSRLLPEWPPTPPVPSIDLDSTRGLVESMSKDNALIGIQLERLSPGMRIGTVDSMTKNRLWLLAIDRSAAWDEAAEGCRITEITAVQRGSRYYKGLQTISDLDKAARISPDTT